MIGSELGGYRIIEQIGMGGMAVVYKAFDPKTERYVALKVLPQQYSKDPTFITRFENEARAITKLEHLHILPVFAYGEQDGISYMAMRYMDSGTLSDRIRKGPLPLFDVARILRQLGEALDYAHSHGILHRDIKPSNALLDKSGNAYLTDFGIAKMVGDSSGLDLTGSGLIGTPFYMSPEQCRGERNLTPASDLYALGVLLYEMLTGYTPYRAETPLAVLQMHLMEPLPNARHSRPDLPEGAAQVVMKALEKEPSNRYPSGRALADAFDRSLASGETAVPVEDNFPTLLGEKPTSTVPPTSRTAASNTQPANTVSNEAAGVGGTQPQIITVIQEKRSPLLYILVGVAVLLAAIPLLLLVLPQETRNTILVSVGVLQATPTATLTLTATPAPTATATVTPTLPPTPLAAAPFNAGTVGVLVASTSSNGQLTRLVRDLSGGGVPVIGLTSQPTTPESQADALTTYNATLLVWTEAADDTAPSVLHFVLRPSAPTLDSDGFAWLPLERFDVPINPDTDDRFIRNLIQGVMAYLNADYDAADAALARAETFMPNDPPVAIAFYRALVAMSNDDWATAVTQYTHVIDNQPASAEAFSNRGVAALKSGGFEAASTDFDQALRLNPDLAYVYNNRALLAFYQGQNDTAVDDLNAAIGIDPSNATLFANRAQVLSNSGQNERAVSDYTRAIELDPTSTRLYVDRALAQAYLNDPQASIDDLNTALERDPANIDALNARGRITAQNGDVTSAEADYRAVLAIDATNYEANFSLADLYFMRGDTDSALTSISSAITGYDGDASAYLLRGRIYSERGQWSEASTDFDRALVIQTEYPEAQAERAYARYRTDYDSAAAITALNEAIAADEYMPFAYNYLGQIYNETDDTEQAIARYQQAIAADSRFRLAYVNLGITYRRLGDYEASVEILSEALTLDPTYLMALAERGRTYTDQGNDDAAGVDLSACRAMDRNFVPCAIYSGYLKYTQSDYFAAIQELTEGLTLAPAAEAYDWRAQAYYAVSNYSAALGDLNRAIELEDTNPTYYARRGLYYAAVNNYAAARTDIDRALELNPDDPYIYYVQGVLNLNQQAFEAAVETFTQAIALEPSAENYRLRALAYRRSGDLDSASADVEQALTLDPTNVNALFEQGEIALTQANWQTAIDRYSVYLEQFPDEVYARYQRGIAYSRSGQLEAALDDFNQSIIGCNEACEQDYTERALVQLALGDSDAALLDFQSALAINANYAAANIGLARTYLNDGDTDNAALFINRAINADDTQPLAFEVRALLLIGQGQREDALNDLDRALTLRQPTSTVISALEPATPVSGTLTTLTQQDAYTFTGQANQTLSLTLETDDTFLTPVLVLRDSGNTALAFNDTDENNQLATVISDETLPAADTYTVIVSSFNAVSMGSYTLTLTTSNVADSALSLDEVNALLEDNPQDVNALLVRADLFLDEGNAQRAKVDANAVLELDDNNAQAYRVLGEVAFREADYDEALPQLDQSIALAPSLEAYILRIIIQRILGNYDAAQTDLDAAFAIEPNNATLDYQQGVVHYLLGDYDRAMQSLTRSISVITDNPLAYYWRGLTHADLSDYEDAIADFDVSIAGCVSECYFDYLERGNAYFALENYAAARADYRSALMLDADLGEAHNGLGQIALRTGDAAAVLTNFNLALQRLEGDVDTTEIFGNRTEYEGYIEDYKSQDVYTFEAARGDIVTVNLDIPASEFLRPILVVRNASNGAIAVSDTDNNGLFQPTISRVVIPRNGEYTLVVASYDAATTGPYVLTIDRR